jgi:hypothetical protein
LPQKPLLLPKLKDIAGDVFVAHWEVTGVFSVMLGQLALMLALELGDCLLPLLGVLFFRIGAHIENLIELSVGRVELALELIGPVVPKFTVGRLIADEDELRADVIDEL